MLRDRADRVEANFEIMRYEPGTPEFEQSLEDIQDARTVLDWDDELAAELDLDDEDDDLADLPDRPQAPGIPWGPPGFCVSAGQSGFRA